MNYADIACSCGPAWLNNSNTKPPRASNSTSNSLRRPRHPRRSQVLQLAFVHTISLLQQPCVVPPPHSLFLLSSAANTMLLSHQYTPHPPPPPNSARHPLPHQRHRRRRPRHHSRQPSHRWLRKHSHSAWAAHSGKPSPVPPPPLPPCRLLRWPRVLVLVQV